MRHSHAVGAALALFTLVAGPASAQSRIERRLALADGGRFVLDTESGSVIVTGDSSSGVSIVLTSERDIEDRYDLDFDERSGEARVTMKRRGLGLLRTSWRDRVRFEVHVPRRALIDIQTAGGSIEARGLAAPVKLDTSGGSITIENVEATVDAHTSGGSITVRRVTGDLDVNTSGGGIDIRDAGGRVDAHTSGGSVSVAFAAGNNRGGDVSSSGGSVQAEVDPAVALSLDASTSGGRVSSDLPVTVRGSLSSRSLRGDVNAGGALLRLHTSGGSVRISRLNARR